MTTPTDLDHLRELIPFYVNNTLSDEDRAAFDAGLKSYPELAGEVDAERRLQSRFNQALEAELGTTGGDQETPAQLRAQPAMPEAKSPGLSGALSFLNPTNWKPAVSLGIVAIALGQTVLIGGQATMIASLEDENYALASGQKDCAEEPDLIVEISADARWADLVELLNGEQLLVTKSTAQGVLMLRTSEDEADVAPILERLNASGLIASAYKAA